MVFEGKSTVVKLPKVGYTSWNESEETRLSCRKLLPRGVIGNTSDFGSLILGSSPSGVVYQSEPGFSGLFLFSQIETIV